MSDFNLQSEYKPAGDQPKAIQELVKGVLSKDPFQVLLGVTGSGKTFTMANLIQEVNRPTLILTHNKTLAGQLYQEFRSFFPENAVEYFVSYYDYYQPEAYVVTTDTFIEKDAGINDEIDKLRMRATTSLLTRNDVIVVASVSCIYGLGNPKDYKDMMLALTVGQEIERDDILKSLVKIQYNRNDIQLDRGCFRVRGDVVEIHPAYDDYLYRIEMFGDEIESLARVHSLTGKVLNIKESISIAPAKHFVTKEENMDRVLQDISVELDSRLKELKNEDKILEYQRLKSRVKYDMEMLDETGFCSGIENYSRIIENRPPGSRPSTLFDFFPQDALFLIDESHVSIPQVGGMFNGDQARKSNLVEYGFRLPSAMDNRPMKFQEFEERYFDSVVYISATPGNYEMEKSEGVVVEQVIRPTGLLDPKIEIHSIENQLDHLVTEIKEVILRDERVLVTTLTKKMAEDLSDYLNDLNLKVRYLHSDIKTPERAEILKDLRIGTFDVLIGINLLREGLDIPEASLVAILDADKEGFLRSHRSLIQTMGRASRNVNGKVILFADRVTDSMKSAIDETSRRRKIQETHNQDHGITPKTVRRKIGEDLKVYDPLQDVKVSTKLEESSEMNVEELEAKMHQAAAELNFEEAARLRDLLQSKGV
jgi:excinuclease ABC subunit B